MQYRELSSVQGARRIQKAIFIADEQDYNYYHFLIEQFTRLFMVLDMEGPVDAVLMYHSNRFMNESLALIGLHGKALSFDDNQVPLFVEELIIPQSHICGIASVYILEIAKQYFDTKLKLWPKQLNSTQKKITVIKRSGTTRIIKNHDQLIAQLQSTFPKEEIVVFQEPFTILETAKLFASSDIVIAPHGSGLSNIIFTRPGSIIIEIYEAEIAVNFNTCFYPLAVAWGNKYYAYYYDNNIVNIEEITNLIKKIIYL